MEETAISTINGDFDHLHRPIKTKKKNGSAALNLIRVALFMLRRRSAAKSANGIASKGIWKSLVGAIRTLHHDGNQSLPPSLDVRLTIPKVESFHDVLQPPVSPTRSEASSSSSSSRDHDHVSVYASAQNLQDLDKSDDDDDDGVDVDGGDEMIDSRAEEFIAHFYEQMRLQRLESMERYNAAI